MLLGSINLVLNLLNQKANSVEIRRLKQCVETMSTTIMTSICAELEPELDYLRTVVNKTSDTLNNLWSNVTHITSTAIPRESKVINDHLTELRLPYNTRLSTLEQQPPVSHIDTPIGISPIPPTATNRACPPQTANNNVPVVDLTPDIDVPPNDGVPAPAKTMRVHNPCPDSQVPPPLLPPPVVADDTYTLPTGHLESGLSGPTTPIHLEVHRNLLVVWNNSCQQCLAMGPPGNPYPPARPTPPINTGANSANEDNKPGDHSPSPCLGSPILSPRENKNCTQGASHFDIEHLASPHYHGKQDGVATLHPGFLEK